MANDPNLRVRISADLADIKQGLGLLRGELAKVKQQSAQAAPGSAWSDGLKSVRTQLAGIVSVYAALRAVRWYADVSDQASKLTGRLRLVTKTQEEETPPRAWGILYLRNRLGFGRGNTPTGVGNTNML